MNKEQIRIKIDNKYYKITIEEEEKEEDNTNTSSSSNLSLTLVTQNNQKVELELIGDNERNYVERHNQWRQRRQSSHEIKTDSLDSLLFFFFDLLFPFLSSDPTQSVKDCLAEIEADEAAKVKPKSPLQK